MFCIDGVKTEDQNYIRSANDDVEMPDAEDDEEEEEIQSELGVEGWSENSHHLLCSHPAKRPVIPSQNRKKRMKRTNRLPWPKASTTLSLLLGTREIGPMLFGAARSATSHGVVTTR